ncbi:hypothetical protein AGMMS49959_10010 [Planctomycetales bacterium]|nr:hypothetical protein AGMMS49959_10010 [Planctomycetales bacterium]
MSLKAKLVLSFLVLVAMTVTLALVMLYSSRTVNDVSNRLSVAYVPQALNAANLTRGILVAGYNFRAYQYSHEEALYQAGMAAIADVEKTEADIDKLLATQAENLPYTAAQTPDIKRAIAEYKRISVEIHDVIVETDKLSAQRAAAGDKVEVAVADYYGADFRKLAAEETESGDKAKLARRFDRYASGLALSRKVGDARRNAEVAERVGNAADREAAYKRARENMDTVLAFARNTRATTAVPVWQTRADAMIKTIEDWEKIVMQVGAKLKQADALAAGRVGYYRDITTKSGELLAATLGNVKNGAEETDADAEWSIKVALVAAIASLVIGVSLALFIAGYIANSIIKIAELMRVGSEQVTTASEMIANTSTSLAEVVVEQSSAVQNTVDSLKEVAKNTRQNATDATKTNEATIKNTKTIEEGAGAVNEMAGAMNGISESSEKIGRIIKTIESIAFQTNLLALNAAVEAARAGEAGKGFAVVAEEVRNLAGRSAQAARDTTELIEDTVGRVQNGASIADKLGTSFKEIEVDSVEISRLVSDIAAATDTQAEHIEKIESSMKDFEQSTTQNSSSAENAAAAAEELMGQAQSLKSYTAQLVKVITG